ncbi:MAG: hypothetical protein EOP51_06120 [Sphingobacteriales bacterium]|nr:MAG: hypothetical protein EOP51_06120 [Sphingobacteriales bacterium]
MNAVAPGEEPPLHQFKLPHKVYSLEAFYTTHRQMVDDRQRVRAWCLDNWGKPGNDNSDVFRYTFWNHDGATYVNLFCRDYADAFDLIMRWS